MKLSISERSVSEDVRIAAGVAGMYLCLVLVCAEVGLRV